MARVVDGHVAVGVREDAVGVAGRRGMDVAGAGVDDRDVAQVRLRRDAIGTVGAGRLDRAAVGDRGVASDRVAGHADRGAVGRAGDDVARVRGHHVAEAAVGLDADAAAVDALHADAAGIAHRHVAVFRASLDADRDQQRGGFDVAGGRSADRGAVERTGDDAGRVVVAVREDAAGVADLGIRAAGEDAVSRIAHVGGIREIRRRDVAGVDYRGRAVVRAGEDAHCRARRHHVDAAAAAIADADVAAVRAREDADALRIAVAFDGAGVADADIAGFGHGEDAGAIAEVGVEADLAGRGVVDVHVAAGRDREHAVGVLAVGVQRAAVDHAHALLALRVHRARRRGQDAFVADRDRAAVVHRRVAVAGERQQAVAAVVLAAGGAGFDVHVAGVDHHRVARERQGRRAVAGPARGHRDRAAGVDARIAVRRHHDAERAVAVADVLGGGDVAGIGHAGGAVQAARGRGDAAGPEDAVGDDVAAVAHPDVRAFAVAGRVDAGRHLGAGIDVVGGVGVGVVIGRAVQARAGDDVAAVADADVAAGLHLDAGDVAALHLDVAAVGDGRAAFAAGRVDAEGMLARRVGDDAARVVGERIGVDLVEARAAGADVAAVADRHRIRALRLDAGRPRVAVGLDRARVRHLDVRARGEDAVGKAVVGHRADGAAVLDAGVARHRIGVDADRIAVDGTGVDVAAVVDHGVAIGDDRADAGGAGVQAHRLDPAGVVDHRIAEQRLRVDAGGFAQRPGADAAAGVVHHGAVVRARRDAGGVVQAERVDAAGIADADIGAAREDAVGDVADEAVHALHARVDVAAVVDQGGAVVGAREHAHRGVAAGDRRDRAAVGDAHVARIRQPEHAYRLAVGIARDRAAGIVDIGIALGDAQHAEAVAKIGIEPDLAAGVVGHLHVAAGGLREHAVGVLAVRVQRTAVVDRHALLALRVHRAGRDGEDARRVRGHVAAVVHVRLAVAGEGQDAGRAVVAGRGGDHADVARIRHAGVARERQRRQAVGHAARVDLDVAAVVDRAVAVRRHHDAVRAVAVLLVLRDRDVAAVLHARGAAQPARGRGDAAGPEDAVGADVAAVAHPDVRAFAVAGRVDAGRDLGAVVVGVVVGAVVVRVQARAGDDVAAVVDADVAAGLHLDADDVAALHLDVAAVGDGRAAFAGGRVDAERLAAGRVADHVAVAIHRLHERAGGGIDVAAVVDRDRIAALRLDARRPGVAVAFDRARVRHPDVRARGEDAVGDADIGIGRDRACVVDRDIAAQRVAVDADRAAQHRAGIQLAVCGIGDRDRAVIAVAADRADVVLEVAFADRVGVVDADVARIGFVDRQRRERGRRDRQDGAVADHGQVGDRGGIDHHRAVAHLALGGECGAGGTECQGCDGCGQRHAHRAGHWSDLDLAAAPRAGRPARMLHAAHITPKVRNVRDAWIDAENPSRQCQCTDTTP